MKSSSPAISAVVFGLAVLLLLLFGLGPSGPCDEREKVAVERGEAFTMAPSLELQELLLAVKPRFEGLALTPPQPVSASYRTSAAAALSGLIFSVQLDRFAQRESERVAYHLSLDRSWEGGEESVA